MAPRQGSIETEFDGQKVSEASENFPSRGSGGQAAIKAAVEVEGLARVVAHSPEIADRIATQKWLREMPDLAGDAEAVAEAIG